MLTVLKDFSLKYLVNREEGERLREVYQTKSSESEERPDKAKELYHMLNASAKWNVNT